MAVSTSGAAGAHAAGNELTLWAALLAGPIAWTFNQGVGYAVVKPLCAGGATYLLWALGAAALALSVAGALMAWRLAGRIGRNAAEHGGTPRDRSYFMALLATAFNLLLGVLIIASLIPQFLLSPCE